MESMGYFWMLFMLFVATLGYQSDANDQFCPSHRRSHPTNCSLFFYCVNITTIKTNHVWVPGKCNFGLVFEPILGMCVIPNSSSSCQRDYPSSTIDLMKEIGNRRINYPLQTPIEEPYLEYEMPINLGDAATDHPFLKPIPSQTNVLRMANTKRPNDKLSMNDYSSTNINFDKLQNEQWDIWNRKNNIQRIQGYPFGELNADLNNSPGFHNYGTNAQNSHNVYSMLNPSYLNTKLNSNYHPINNPLLKTNNGPDLKNRPANLGNFNRKNYHEYQNYITDSSKTQDEKTNSFVNENSKEDAGVESTNTFNENGMKKYPQQEEEEGNGNVNPSTDTEEITESTNEVQNEADSSPESTTIEIHHSEHQTKQRRQDCKHGGRVPDLNDCTKYFMCDTGGDLVSHSCPHHTSFNSYTKKCETKVYQDCLQQLHKSVAQPSYFDTYNDYDEVSSNPLVPQFHSVTSASPQLEDNFKCFKEGKFSDPLSSASYYICTFDEDQKTLVEHKIPCPGSLHFCAKKKICTYADRC